MKKYFSEYIGTFILVFLGTGAVIFNQFSSGTVTHVGISLVFGLTVLFLIYTLGDVSGAHINPAVTLGFWAAGRFNKKDTLFYIIFQMLGAVSASLVLAYIIGGNSSLGTTDPIIINSKAFVVEFLLTFILMFVILNVSTGAKEKGITAGIAIGSVIAVEALLAGPITGASMNPARSFGPALVSGHFEHLWVYLSAPVAGALFGVLIFKKVIEKQ